MNIEDLDPIQSIRRRPGMYVGDVNDGSGLHHMIWEVVGNAVDQHLAGAAARIEVVLHDDGSVSVEDDGPGVSVEPLAAGTPLLVEVLTRYHDRATFDGHPKHVHLDGVGVGLVMVNALSRLMVVETARGGRRHRIELARGVPGPLLDLGPTEGRGTRVSFAPDPEIFTRLELDSTAIRKRLRQVAAFCPDLAIHFADERRTVFSCPDGLATLLADERHAPTGRLPERPLRARTEQDGAQAEVALQWALGGEGSVRGFVNLYETRDGGTHLAGLRRGLGALVPRDTPRRARVLEELRARLVAVVAIALHEPQFDSPTRSKLHNPEIMGMVEALVRRCLRDFAAREPEVVARLLDACDPEPPGAR